MITLLKILIYYPLLNILMLLIWATPGHYGWIAIVLLTLLVRFVLLIPSKRAAQAQRKMNQLQPLLEELKKEYGDDKQGLAVAQMELYKKNNINPFGSCLTALIQLPILIALYRAFLHGFTSSEHLYSFVPHVTNINMSFFGINLLQPDKFYILPIIAAAFQYYQMKLTVPKTEPKPNGEVDPNVMTQRMMVYFIPGMTLLVARSFPAGAALYWIVSTIFSIVQQMLINKEKYNLAGVEKALTVVDKAHPEHKPRSAKVEHEIQEQTHTQKGVSVTVRKKKS